MANCRMYLLACCTVAASDKIPGLLGATEVICLCSESINANASRNKDVQYIHVPDYVYMCVCVLRLICW